MPLSKILVLLLKAMLVDEVRLETHVRRDKAGAGVK